MPVIITPLTADGGPSPLLKKIFLPGHGHISQAEGSDDFYVDVFGLPAEITHYTVDLINSELVRVRPDGLCPICKSTCPCCNSDDEARVAQDWPSLRDDLAFTEAEEAEIADEVSALQARQGTKDT